MEKRFIGVKELAVYLSLSEETIRSWVWQRRIPIFKIGRAVRFDLKQIESWLQANKSK